jgi:hypothetical protein
VLTGLALGIPTAVGAARLLRSQLYGVEPSGAAHLCDVRERPVAAAAVAATLPAVRAGRVHPIVTMRTDA